MKKIALLAAALVLGCVSAQPTAPPASRLTKRLPSVSELTVDEKIGQLFVQIGYGTFMNENSASFQTLLHHVRDNHLGGIHWHTPSVYEAAWLTRRLQEAARVPLLVSADLEAGIGMRFQNTTFWPWAMAVAATGDPGFAEQLGRVTAREATLLGVNQVYAPVADVNNDPDNPVINVRSFGEDPQTVARFVAAFTRGLESGRVLATVKHFPGHGDTHIDSHRALPVLNISRERLEQVELVPFRASLEAGAGSVMLAHLSFPALDPTPAPPLVDQRPEENPYKATVEEIAEDATMPASLSGPIVDLLRRDLRFDGLVVTDAMDMGGITRFFDPAEAAIRAIEAGVDQVLGSMDTDLAIAGVKAALQSGRLSMRQIDAAVGRVLRAKAKVGFDVASQEELFRHLDSPEARELAQQIATRAITLVREQPGVLPLSHHARPIVIVINDVPEMPQVGPFNYELSSRLGFPPPSFYVDGRSDSAEMLPIVEAAKNATAVLILFTVRFGSGKGTIGLPPAAADLLSQLGQTGVPLIGISFGTPYLIRDLPQVGTYFAAYGPQPVMQAAAGRALFGEMPVSGRLPVSIPGLYPIGHGIMKSP